VLNKVLVPFAVLEFLGRIFKVFVDESAHVSSPTWEVGGPHIDNDD